MRAIGGRSGVVAGAGVFSIKRTFTLKNSLIALAFGLSSGDSMHHRLSRTVCNSFAIIQESKIISPEVTQYSGLYRKRLWMTLNPVARLDCRGQFQYVK